MARKLSKEDPALAIEFFLSGFYTHRSQLFAPFKNIGINVVSFHDPVIDGKNMEDTDLYEWTRRPGFSIFCSQPLPDHEVVNQFYSSRTLNGTVVPWIDTNQRWATFSPTAITTIAAKNTTAQGYPSTIGNMTYFSDGVAKDLYKYDGTNLSAWGLAAPTITPVSSGMGFWQPYTQFTIGDSILDTNGCVESVTSILIPNGGLESPTTASTLALGGSFAGTWTYDSAKKGYFVSTGYRLVQQGSNKTETDTVTFTFSNPVAVGNTIVLVFGEGSTNFTPAVVSVTDSLGNTYTQQATGSGYYPGGGGNKYYSTAWVWSAPVTIGGTCTVSVTITGSEFPSEFQILAHEFFGINATAASNAHNFQYNVYSLNTGTVTFATPDLVLSSLLLFSTGAGTKPSGYVNGTSHADGEWQLFDAYKGPTSPQSPTWSILNGDGQALGISVVFPVTSLATGYSPYLFLGDVIFNPPIPTGAIILGIQVSLPKWDSAFGTVVDESVKLVIGGSVTGNDYASATSWSTSGYATANYGGPADKWGLSPTAAQLNTTGLSGFGVAISANITDLTGDSVIPTVGFDAPHQPTVTVYYKQATGLGGPGFSGANEPIWPTSVGLPVNDGGITWTNYGPIQTWYPVTGYPSPIVVLDPNGNLQLSTSVANPIAAWDASATYTQIGQIVYFGGQYWINLVTSNHAVAPSVNYATTGSSITAPYWALTTSPVVTGLLEPVWNTTVGGTTKDGSYTWTNIGQGTGLAFTGYAYVYGFRTIYGHLTTSSPFSNNTGAILGPVNATVTSYAVTSNVVTFEGDNNFLPGNVFKVAGLTFGTDFNDQVFTVVSAVPSSSFPLTSVGVVSGTSTLTVLAINNLVAGQKVTFSGVGTATFLNGVTVTVLAAGLSSSQFTATFAHSDYGPTADVGMIIITGSYTVNFTHADVSYTQDSGAALPLISTITGAGTASSLCNFIATISAVSVTADIVRITASNNFQVGLWVTLVGFTGATFLNSQQVQVIAVDQPIGTLNTWFEVYFRHPNYGTTAIPMSDGGTATFNAIEIYRTSDGGGSYLFTGAVTNSGTGPFSYDDFTVDDDLDAEMIAPLSHQNDPPPGAPGSIILTTGNVLVYWQGRLWMANGNYVYFDAGPDCDNGVPEESWPPGNRFQFAGPVLNMTPTPDGDGLLVYLADRVDVILGGPETISFYPKDTFSNFGISSSNAIFKDGSIIGLFTTQKQYFELVGTAKNEIGEHISDYLSANFAADKAYVTSHRDGLDVGTFISNGVDQVLRFGSNIGAWSVPSFPACGAGALQSIETSVGVMSLMLASPTGGITASTAMLNPTSSISTESGVAWATPGNVTLGTATTYATVTFTGAGSSQVLRVSAYAPLAIPVTAIIKGIQVILVGKQSAPSGLAITITPTNPAVGAEFHTFALGSTNTTMIFGGSADLWGMPWSIPNTINGGALSFDISVAYTG